MVVVDCVVRVVVIVKGAVVSSVKLAWVVGSGNLSILKMVKDVLAKRVIPLQGGNLILSTFTSLVNNIK